MPIPLVFLFLIGLALSNTNRGPKAAAELLGPHRGEVLWRGRPDILHLVSWFGCTTVINLAASGSMRGSKGCDLKVRNVLLVKLREKNPGK